MSNLTILIAIVTIIFSPLVGLGMYLDDLTYWLALDIAMICFYPIAGVRLLQLRKK